MAGALSTPNHIAIVGGGFAGISTFFQLVDRYPVKQITKLSRRSLLRRQGERLLATDDESLYREKLESSVPGYAARCPISTLQKLVALHAAGRLSVVRGVREVSFDTASDGYRIAHQFGVERALNLVNTTGRMNPDFARS